jgi:acetolactate synthase regulatory subunit
MYKKFDPDIFDRLSRNGIMTDVGSADKLNFVSEFDRPDDKTDALVDVVDQYIDSLDAQHKKIYDYTKFAIATSKNPLDSENMFRTFNQFWLKTVKELYTEQDFTDLEIKIRESEEVLNKTLRSVEHKDNNWMISVLLGMLKNLL